MAARTSRAWTVAVGFLALFVGVMGVFHGRLLAWGGALVAEGWSARAVGILALLISWVCFAGAIRRRG